MTHYLGYLIVVLFRRFSGYYPKWQFVLNYDKTQLFNNCDIDGWYTFEFLQVPPLQGETE